MNTYIALLRGINVGGNNKLPMRELVTVLAELGMSNIKTYIQSGNVIFQSERVDRVALAQEISTAIGTSHGFMPAILLLDKHELAAVMAANPFPEGADEPKSLLLFFLEALPPNPDIAMLEQLKAENERYALIDKVFYLYAPDGIGRSKVAEKFGKGWKVAITARNWRTVCQIMAMAGEVAAQE